MLAVEMGRRHGCDEELRAVRVLAGVGHAQEALALVLRIEVLIGELLPVDALTTSTISVGEVAALDHEILDNTVELRPLVAEALFHGCESPEVLCGLRGALPVQSHDYPSGSFSANFDIKKDEIGDERALRLGFARREGVAGEECSLEGECRHCESLE